MLSSTILAVGVPGTFPGRLYKARFKCRKKVLSNTVQLCCKVLHSYRILHLDLPNQMGLLA